MLGETYLVDVLDQLQRSPNLAPVLEHVNQMSTDLQVRRLGVCQHALHQNLAQCNIDHFHSESQSSSLERGAKTAHCHHSNPIQHQDISGTSERSALDNLHAGGHVRRASTLVPDR